jgi:hypothetical protein
MYTKLVHSIPYLWLYIYDYECVEPSFGGSHEKVFLLRPSIWHSGIDTLRARAPGNFGVNWVADIWHARISDGTYSDSGLDYVNMYRYYQAKVQLHLHSRGEIKSLFHVQS